MRHGTKLRKGFSVGQRVRVTSKRLCLNRMPAIATGDSPTHLRVRLYIPTSNDTIVVWAKFTEVKPAHWRRDVRAKLYHHGHKIRVDQRL